MNDCWQLAAVGGATLAQPRSFFIERAPAESAELITSAQTATSI